MALGLKVTKVAETASRLTQRVAERFPESSLLALCKALQSTAEQTRRRANRIARPNLWLRMLVLLVIGGALASFGWVVNHLITTNSITLETTSLEAGANLMILAGTAIWFLVTLEQRMRRRQVLERLHELRSLAHIVDMHQLTKDPTVILSNGAPTASSPARNMSVFELGRYLDYCTEMLSIVGKLAAVYGERTRDTEVVAAVNDLETLTTGLGRKVWQKIMLLHDPDRLRSGPSPRSVDLAQQPTHIRS
ncbi:MAG: hypothetical protein AAGA48_34995 [Myxococcota bacterium]